MSETRMILTNRLATAAGARGEELLAEISGSARKIGLLMVVLAVSVPTFLGACFALIAWRLLG